MFRGSYRTTYGGWNILRVRGLQPSRFYPSQPENLQGRGELERLEERKKFLEEKILNIQTRIEHLAPTKCKSPPLSGTKTGLKAVIDRVRCFGCGICANFCPERAIKIIDGPLIDRLLCTGCGTCIPLCPRNAISLNSVAEVQ